MRLYGDVSSRFAQLSKIDNLQVLVRSSSLLTFVLVASLFLTFGNLVIFSQAQAGAIIFVAPTGQGTSAPFIETPGQQPVEIQTSLVTVSGSVPAPAVSPDGRWISVVGQTYQDESDSAYNIYAFSPTGADFHHITSFTTPQQQGYAALPEGIAFSPDDSKIAFTVETYGNGAKSASLLFCDVATCTQTVSVGSVSVSGFDGMGVAWSPDGGSLVSPVTCGTDCPDDPSTGYPVLVTDLRIMPAVSNGGDQAVELTLPLSSSYSNAMMQVLPVFSPDGTTVAFVVWDMNLNLNPGLSGFSECQSSSIYVVSSKGGTPSLVATIQNSLITSVSWVNDPGASGTLLFSEAQPSNLQSAGVWEVNVDGSGLQEVMNKGTSAVWSSSLVLSQVNNTSSISNSKTSGSSFPSASNTSSQNRTNYDSTVVGGGFFSPSFILPVAAVVAVAAVLVLFVATRSTRSPQDTNRPSTMPHGGSDISPSPRVSPAAQLSCSNCGSKLGSNERFCAACGYRVAR
jgi:hypothetical protein